MGGNHQYIKRGAFSSARPCTEDRERERRKVTTRDKCSLFLLSIFNGFMFQTFCSFPMKQFLSRVLLMKLYVTVVTLWVNLPRHCSVLCIKNMQQV